MNLKYEQLIVRVWEDGLTQYLDKNMQLHRENGPAVKYPNGDEFWFLHGELHNPNGPACVRHDGRKEWYLHGKELTEQEFLARTSTCNGKIVEIDGKKYKLTEV